MPSFSLLLVAMTTVFLASFMLFYIFDSINKIATECKEGIRPQHLCKAFTGFTLDMIIVLLLIGGFIIIISSTVFILIR